MLSERVNIVKNCVGEGGTDNNILFVCCLFIRVLGRVDSEVNLRPNNNIRYIYIAHDYTKSWMADYLR